MIGKENDDIILINNVGAKALIDSGSSISTITEEFLQTLNPQPEISSLEDFDLDVRAAGGHSLSYKGYVVVEVNIPFSNGEPLQSIMLVMPETDYTTKVPVIVGTNIIRRFNPGADEHSASEAWKTAFHSICNKHLGTVKTTQKVVLQPYESKIITGLTRKTQDVESAVTEPAEEGATSRVSVCPRVVTLNKAGTTARVPVRIFNLSAKPVTIPSKTLVCELKEVTVLRSADLTQTPKHQQSAQIHQQSTASSQNMTYDKIDLEDSCLSDEQKKETKAFLHRWQHIFSSGSLDLGHTKTVKHEIHLDNEQPFKEP